MDEQKKTTIDGGVAELTTDVNTKTIKRMLVGKSVTINYRRKNMETGKMEVCIKNKLLKLIWS